MELPSSPKRGSRNKDHLSGRAYAFLHCPLESQESVIYYGDQIRSCRDGRNHTNQSGE